MAKKEKCAYCYGFGLDADLSGAGYRFPIKKVQTTLTARIDCDRCGTGGTPNGPAHAERSRHRLESVKAKEGHKK